MHSPDLTYVGERAVVLGAAGFIGRHVALALRRRGAEVTAVDRPGCDAPLVGVDLARREDVQTFLREARPAYVFNLAGYGVLPQQRDEQLARALNTILPATLCLTLADTEAVLVHVGSAFEYGAVGGDLDELGPTQPTSRYAKTKRRGTLAIQLMGPQRGLRAVAARLFTVYGPGEQPQRLLPSILRAARTGETLPMTDGAQRRDFTFVGDVAEGLCRLGLADAPPGEVVNLATGTLTSVRGFVEIAASVLGIPDEQLAFGALESRPDEMAHDPPAVVRLRRRVGWTPPTGIADGVRLTAESDTVEGNTGVNP
jgi:nucleoside-diphosphate-sugar epimerase